LIEHPVQSREKLTLQSTVVAASNQLSAQLNGEVVILGVQSGSYFGLDQVAARIWSLVQQPMCCADIALTIYDEFEVEQEQAERDVINFVHKLG
jgi:hypothetical protein